MKPAIIFGKTTIVLEADGTVMIDGGYWLRSENVYLDAIEFFILAIKNLKGADEKRRAEQAAITANSLKRDK